MNAPFIAPGTWRLSLNRVSAVAYCGGLNVTIEQGAGYLEGAPADVLAALRTLPIGVSVEVRRPRSIRSCMNKPQLWADLESALEEESA